MNTQAPVTKLFVKQTNVFQDKKWELFKYKRDSEFHLYLVMLIDLILLNLTILGSMWLVFQITAVERDFTNFALGLFFSIANLLWVFVISFTNVYKIFGGIRLDLKIKELFLSNLIFFGAISLIYSQFFFFIFEIQFLILAFISFTVISALTHLGMRYYYNRTQASPFSYVVVGGTASNFHYLKNIFDSIYGNNIQCLGRFANKEIKGVKSLGNFDQIEGFIKRNDLTKVLYINSTLSKSKVQRIMQLCRSRIIEFEVVPKEVEFFQKGIQVEQLAHMPIFCRKKEPLCELKNKLLKRAFDFVFSFLVLLLIFPWLLPILALLIKLESRGPVFFVQKRTGYWNKPFNCFKFRTMKLNDQSDTLQATKDDARITRIGAFLRKTNIDELPQFYNVLKGQMSVVGPRPHMLKHTEVYSQLIEQFMIRHEVKPGISGWAQVSGWRGPTNKVYQMEQRVEHDVTYIENWSIWFDCKIIFLTVLNIYRGEENAI